MHITLDDFVLIDFSRGNLPALLFHVSADGRIAQLAVQLFEAGKESEAESAWDHMTRRGPLLSAVFPAAATASVVAEIRTLRDERALLAVLARRTADVDVVSLANVFDVLRDGSVGADTVFVHERDQFAFL